MPSNLKLDGLGIYWLILLFYKIFINYGTCWSTLLLFYCSDNCWFENMVFLSSSAEPMVVWFIFKFDRPSPWLEDIRASVWLSTFRAEVANVEFYSGPFAIIVCCSLTFASILLSLLSMDSLLYCLTAWVSISPLFLGSFLKSIYGIFFYAFLAAADSALLRLCLEESLLIFPGPMLWSIFSYFYGVGVGSLSSISPESTTPFSSMIGSSYCLIMAICDSLLSWAIFCSWLFETSKDCRP